MPSAIDIIWIGVGCVSGMLAVIHFEAWRVRRSESLQLTLSVLAVTVAGSAFLELAALRASTVADYAFAYRWANALSLPMVVATVMLVLSVSAGRRRLAAVVILTRAVATVANFSSGDSVGYKEFTDLRLIVTPWGDTVSGPIGQLNPWLAVGMASNLLLLVFLGDAMHGLFRRPPSPDRSRRLRIVGGVLAFATVVIVYSVSVIVLGAPMPIAVAPHYLLMLLIVGRELGSELARSADLAAALRLSESSLHETRRDMELAERSGGLALWSWRPGSDEIALSDAGRSMVGLRPGARFTHEEQCQRLEPDDHPLIRDLLAKVLNGEAEQLKAQLRVRLSGGQLRWLAVFGNATRSDAGNLIELHGVAFDLSEQGELDEQFKAVVGASPTAMLLVAEDGRILMANESAMQLTGYPRDELLGRSIEALVPEESAHGHPAHRRVYSAAASQRRMSPRRDVMLRRREGTRVPVEVALNSVTIHGNAFVVAAVTDLRERLEKELEIANQRNMLAHMSRVALLSELSGSLAHEINQPLTAILSNAQASVRYLDRPQPDLVEVKEGLIEVIESAKRAGEVIRRLRAMLRNDPPEMAMLDVNVAVKDVVRIVRSDLIECGVGYSVQLDEGLPMVLGDQVQLQQVLINLINNACDAMDGTGRGKHLRLSTGKAEGGVVLGVSDSGQGIPEADLARIFEPFVSSKADGLGFGLALCTTLIEAQGGRIWATNNPDVGATFHVLLREYKNDRAE